MIAIDEHELTFPLEDIGEGFSFRWKPRLHPVELDHQTQQRSDDFFARENQHIRQNDQSARGILDLA